MTTVCLFSPASSPALLAPLTGHGAAWRAVQPAGGVAQHHHHHL